MHGKPWSGQINSEVSLKYTSNDVGNSVGYAVADASMDFSKAPKFRGQRLG